MTSTVTPVDPPTSPDAQQGTTECRTLPNDFDLCGTEWGAPLETTAEGWSNWLNFSFKAGGTMAWTHFTPEATGKGTWSSDGTTIWVHFDKSPPGLGSDLTLTLGKFERGCGEENTRFMADTLVSQQPSLRFEPMVC
ncbi:MAG: hypothetical protein FWF02_12200 [Micrococcales bacterium]|nr:hypothetical protein [Micrococcales bacterium]MCL2668445.1 hypothetical protein [Micrococcales bacterium]